MLMALLKVTKPSFLVYQTKTTCHTPLVNHLPSTLPFSTLIVSQYYNESNFVCENESLYIISLAAALVQIDVPSDSVGESDGSVQVNFTLTFTAGSEIDLIVPFTSTGSTGKYMACTSCDDQKYTRIIYYGW